MNFWETGSRDGMNGKLNEYACKSEEQLLGELAEVARRMKNDGSFDPKALENLYNTSYPFLNDEQRRRMRALIDLLKN